ncbi:MAG: hypothetical protein KAX53_02145 [Saprospiraceae bacterium]|nr:hypothetical protein [Saprospiraceae bacterium]MBK9744797.1 hypothetical protein [Saprospiraceae bacterium]MBP8212516.1 hypothetical protein [Saprospiraceae bacterium]
MVTIPESIINDIIDQYQDEQKYLTDLKQLSSEQPDLIAFIDQENYSLLTNDEIALLEYLTLVIYFSSMKMIEKTIQIQGKSLEAAEEDNWNTFNEITAKSFFNKLDSFFKDYPQEDLLALVEDSIQQDEDNIVTPVGREIIFVACKSIIDTIHS